MRIRLLLTTLVLALVVGAALPAPAGAAEDDSIGQMSLSATTIPTNGSVTFKSTDPCPTPSQSSFGGTTTNYVLTGVYLFVLPWTGQAGIEKPLTTNPDGSWTSTVDAGGSLKPGRYLTFGFCMEGPSGTPPQSSLPYFLYTPTELDVRVADGVPEPVTRLAGADRIETAIGVSKDIFAKGSADTVVLARADNYADSLAGTPLALAYGAPLLLTSGDSLDSRTAAELARVFGSGGEVLILGGTGAISQHVQDQLEDRGYDVQRFGGLNRFATAARIASSDVFDDTGISRIFLADGTDFHDGLVAGAAARTSDLSDEGYTAVLLTDGRRMPDETNAVIQANPDAVQYAIGTVAAKAAPRAIAVGGADPTATALAVAKQFFPTPKVVGVASSAGFADALAGGLHAALSGGPLLYTNGPTLPATVDAYLAANKSSLLAGWVYGGTGAIPEAVRQTIATRING